MGFMYNWIARQAAVQIVFAAQGAFSYAPSLASENAKYAQALHGAARNIFVISVVFTE